LFILPKLSLQVHTQLGACRFPILSGAKSDQPLNTLVMNFTRVKTRAKGIANALVHTDAQASYISLADEVITTLVGIRNPGHDCFRLTLHYQTELPQVLSTGVEQSHEVSAKLQAPTPTALFCSLCAEMDTALAYLSLNDPTSKEKQRVDLGKFKDLIERSAQCKSCSLIAQFLLQDDPHTSPEIQLEFIGSTTSNLRIRLRPTKLSSDPFSTIHIKPVVSN
jgi:hypothetical protein